MMGDTSSVSAGRLLRLLHRWLGLTLGLWVLAVSVSGGLLLFKGPYLRYTMPELGCHHNPGDTQADLQMVEKIEADLADQKIRVIGLPRAGLNGYHLWLADGSEAYFHSTSGELLRRWRWSQSLPAFLFELHAHLLGGETGHVLNGVFGLLLLFTLVTSPMVWWPRRNGFRPGNLVPGKSSPRAWLRFHESWGLILLIPLALVIATGAGMVFFGPVSAFLSGLLDDSPAESIDRSPTVTDGPRLEWDRMAAAAYAAFPEAELVFIYPPAQAGEPVVFRMRLPGEWHPNGRSYVVVDSVTGSVLQQIDARSQGLGSRISQSIYPLHSGQTGGVPYAALILVVALVLSSLVLSGGWSYLARRRRRLQRLSRLEAGSLEGGPWNGRQGRNQTAR